MRIAAASGLTLSLAAAAATLAGCGREESGPIAVSAVGEPPRILNPNRDPLDPASALLLQATAQGLVRFDAGGEIEPALAQRWIVSDDGLRYTFRLGRALWSGGGRVTARQVVARLKAAAAPASRNPLKPILGAVAEIEALTDDVLEIRLKSPRPNFLHLLAQPEMAVIDRGAGTGPYRAESAGSAAVRLLPPKPDDDEEKPRPPVLLRGEPASVAVGRFALGESDLVLGGSAGDLPLARAAGAPAASLRFDPSAGLFGLAFDQAEGLFQRAEARQALSMAVDRAAIVAALAVPGLQPRETLLPPGIEGLPTISAAAWIRQPLAERRAAAARAIRTLTEGGRATVRVALPEGPGHDLLFAHLRRDWAAIGLEAVRVAPRERADVRLVDQVAPAALASWYLRRFKCDSSPVCDPAADELVEAARIAPDVPARRGLFIAADRILAGLAPYIPIAAPVRWSLVSPRLNQFRTNAFARHPLGELVRPQP